MSFSGVDLDDEVADIVLIETCAARDDARTMQDA